MTERIEDLWEEATVSTWPRLGKFTAGEYDYHLRKFAELIVRECADVLDKRIAPPNHPMNSLGYKLKQHFGFE